MKERIVVTGYSSITPLGRKSGGIGDFNRKSIPESLKGLNIFKVENFDTSQDISPMRARKFDRLSLYSYIVVKDALVHANLKINEDEKHDIGLVYTSYFGSFAVNFEQIKLLVESGVSAVSAFWFPSTTFNAAAGVCIREIGIKGCATTVVGGDGLLYGKQLLDAAQGKVILLVGGEEVHSPIIEALGDIGLFSCEEKQIYVGEGWGCVVLEREDHACQRGAEIYAVLEGCISVRGKCEGYGNYYELNESMYRELLSFTYKIIGEERFLYSPVANNFFLFQREKQILESIFKKEQIVYLEPLKFIIGDTIGASGVVGAVYALSCLQENQDLRVVVVPVALPNGVISSYVFRKVR